MARSRIRPFIAAVMCTACAAVVGCPEDGGGGGGVPASPSAILRGTVASGAPVAGAAVLVKDRTGAQSTTTTAADGKYAIDIGGLTAPFLIRATPVGGSPLFGFAAAAPATANAHPLTTLLLDAYYRAQGESLATSFNGLTSATIVPGPSDVRTLSYVLRQAIGRWILAAGHDPATFDFFTTPFDANGAGFDAVLDQTAIAADTIVISGGGVTTTATITVGAGEVTFDQKTTGSEAESEGTATLCPPGEQDACEAAIAGVETMLKDLFATESRVNASGVTLTAADLLRFFDANYLSNGTDAATTAADRADERQGGLFEFVSIDRVFLFDDAAGLIELAFTHRITEIASGRTSIQPHVGHRDERGTGDPFRRQQDGTWRFFGNRHAAQGRVEVEVQRNIDDTPTSTVQLNMQLQTERDLPPAIATATFTGIFPPDPTPSTKSGTNTLITVPFFPPAGTSYRVEITLADGTPVTRTPTILGWTTETIDILSYNGIDRQVARPGLADILGKTLVVVWTPVHTYTPLVTDLQATLNSPGGQEFLLADIVLGPTATSAPITIPAEVNGEAVTSVIIQVNIAGEHGERTVVRDTFD